MTHPLEFITRRLVIYGAGSQAIVLDEFLSPQGMKPAVILNDWPTDFVPIEGVPVVCGALAVEAWLDDAISEPQTIGEPWSFVVAIGNGHGRIRVERHNMLAARGLDPITARHPIAHVATDAKIGPGCQILCRAIVAAKATLGTQVILNSGSQVDHECEIADGVHIGPGAVLCGRVKVGRHSFVGAGSVVLPDIRIGEDSTIGAGSVVTRDVPDGVVMVGSPARAMPRAAQDAA